MLELPESIEVLVTDTVGRPLVGILVELDFRWHGNYYFGTHAGLSDSDGLARVPAAQIALASREDQSLFPMDYKVPLDQCDDTIAIGFLGANDFMSARADAIASGLVTARAKTAWARAANSNVLSRRIDIPVSAGQPTLRVPLQLEQAS